MALNEFKGTTYIDARVFTEFEGKAGAIAYEKKGSPCGRVGASLRAYALAGSRCLPRRRGHDDDSEQRTRGDLETDDNGVGFNNSFYCAPFNTFLQ